MLNKNLKLKGTVAPYRKTSITAMTPERFFVVVVCLILFLWYGDCIYGLMLDKHALYLLNSAI
jgi:hypothetical protein